VDRPVIDSSALHAALDHRWSRVEVVEATGSTNADLLADPQAPDRSLLVAEAQLAGRGRLDRSWVAPPRAGLTFSTLWRPATPTATWSWLPLLAGVALHDAVAETTGLPIGLKWPNDLLVGDPLAGAEELKVAGILAQTGSGSPTPVVIGIGLNVSTERDELPVPTATSLALALREAGASAGAAPAGAASTRGLNPSALDRTALLIAIATQLDRRMEQWTSAGGDATACGLAADYTARCRTIGRAITVSTTSGAAISGVAHGVDPDGRLQVLVDGAMQLVGAGDVEHLRLNTS
jgi:BirA family biotin operon repressor/biotin-[acetyl-CoA-carboxylase] ligase